MRFPLAIAILVGTVLWAEEDPLAAPPELQIFVRQATMGSQGNRPKLQALLSSIFRSAEEGGLGITYDNSRTRTVSEVWTDRRANCLSLTALYVAASRSLGLDAHYGEPLNTNRWRRLGNVVRYERHVVAIAPLPPMEDAVADFLPQLRRRTGSYLVALMPEARFRALFYSNRAVELMDDGDPEAALDCARLSVRVDPTSAVGWNIQGVVLKGLNQLAEAERAFRKAIALDPKDGTPVGNMEMLTRAQGRLEEAAKFRLMSAELRKKDPYYHAFLADEAIAEGRWEEAHGEIRTAIRLQPYDPEFFVIQARILLQKGEVDAATRSLEAARRWAVPTERERFDSKLAALKRISG